MVSLRRQSVERNWWMVSGRSLSLGRHSMSRGRWSRAPWSSLRGYGLRDTRECTGGRPTPRSLHRMRWKALTGQSSRARSMTEAIASARSCQEGTPVRSWCGRATRFLGRGQRRHGRPDEPVPLGDDDRRTEVAESGNRCGHGRPPCRDRLVGLDRVEALGERVDQVGDDHHVGVGQIGRNGEIRTGTDQVNVREIVQDAEEAPGVRLSGPSNTTARSGRVRASSTTSGTSSRSSCSVPT